MIEYNESVHVSILLPESVGFLEDSQWHVRLKERDLGNPLKLIAVDCTLGGGGHTRGFLEALKTAQVDHQVLAVDTDKQAIERASQKFEKELQSSQLKLIHSDFAHALSELPENSVDFVYADLGFSSDQIESGNRGLSFMKDGPLDMRLNPDAGQSARDWLLRAPENEIADVIFQFGEERYSRRIARAVVEHRQNSDDPLSSTLQFADLIRGAVPREYRYGRIHPATRTFQAIRIYINDELEQLTQLLENAYRVLRVGGRLGVISFHSLEDRSVKNAFKEKSRWKALTKKPIEASELEVEKNPRSRSAKLRFAEKVGVDGGSQKF